MSREEALMKFSSSQLLFNCTYLKPINIGNISNLMAKKISKYFEIYNRLENVNLIDWLEKMSSI